MIKILLVEDEDRSIEQTSRSIRLVFPEVELFVARNLRDAERLVGECSFDFGICDLRISSHADALDASDVHGRAVYELLRKAYPGTPVIFLSAYASWENVGDQVASGGVADIYGVQGFRLTRVVQKGDPRRIEEALTEIADGLARLQGCEVSSEVPLEEVFKRAVQTYGLSLGSPRAQVRWKSGLSGAKVALVEYEQTKGADVVVAVKLDRHDRAQREIDRYDTNVGPRLHNGSFASRLSVQKAGLRGKYAIISAVATRTAETFFQRLSDSPSSVDISAVRDALAGWRGVVERRSMTIGAYRNSIIALDDLRALPEFDAELTSLDAVSVDLAFKLGHGDFHGENIFIDDDGRSVAIDYADCGLQPAGLDAMALELSLYTHPRSPVGGDWTLLEYALWADTNSFTAGKYAGEQIIALRQWALEEGGELQWLVVAYGQACWLMKHGHPGSERVARIAISALRRIALSR